MTPEQFLYTADLLSTPLLLIDTTGMILSANHAAIAFLAFSKTELIHKTFYDLVKQSSANPKTYLRNCSISREFLPGEFQFSTKHGVEFSCRTEGCIASPATDSMPAQLLIQFEKKLNKKLRISALANEIKNKELALAHYGRQLNLALRATGVAVWELDLATNKVTRSKNHEKLFGYAEELDKWTLDIFLKRVHPEDIHIFHDIITRRFEISDPLSVEYRVIWPDGSVHWLLSQGELRRNESHEPTQIAGATIDITNFKTIEANLNQAVGARDEFLSIASHELRTPLTALKLQLDMIKRQLFGKKEMPVSFDKLVKIITVSSTQTDKLKILVDDLFDLSRITAGKLDIQLAPTNLAFLLQELIEKHGELLQVSGCTITLEVKHAVTVTCDKFRIEQAISNLLTNAEKYGCSKPISVTLNSSNNKAIIAIKDQGMGIPKDKLEKIFERFERAIDQNTISGLGLGLYITQEIIKLHQGKIGVESEPGQGSTFMIELPLTLAV